MGSSCIFDRKKFLENRRIHVSLKEKDVESTVNSDRDRCHHRETEWNDTGGVADDESA
jgi:hypothetical protein